MFDGIHGPLHYLVTRESKRLHLAITGGDFNQQIFGAQFDVSIDVCNHGTGKAPDFRLQTGLQYALYGAGIIIRDARKT